MSEDYGKFLLGAIPPARKKPWASKTQKVGPFALLGIQRGKIPLYWVLDLLVNVFLMFD